MPQPQSDVLDQAILDTLQPAGDSDQGQVWHLVDDHEGTGWSRPTPTIYPATFIMKVRERLEGMDVAFWEVEAAIRRLAHKGSLFTDLFTPRDSPHVVSLFNYWPEQAVP